MTADSRTRALVVIAQTLADARSRDRPTDKDRALAQTLLQHLEINGLAVTAWLDDDAPMGGPAGSVMLAPGAAVLHAVKDEASR